jgi:hypothetical protein
MMKFFLWAIVIPAACIALLTYVAHSAPCDGFGCIANGIFLFAGFGAITIGSVIAGVKFSPTHRAVYAVLFPAITILLIILSARISSRIFENVYEMNLANDREAAKFGIPSMALYTAEPTNVAIPATLTGSFWAPIQSVCAAAGYDLPVYVGKNVLSLRYAIWSQSYNGLPVGVVVLNDHYDVVCMYKEILQKEDGPPVALPSPNVFAIDDSNGFVIRLAEPQYKGRDAF